MKKKIILLFFILFFTSISFYISEEKLKTQENNTTPIFKSENSKSFNYLYETDAESASDCTSYENYDSVKNTCSYTCSSEEECLHLKEEIDKEIEGWVSEADDADTKQVENENASLDKNTIATYVVKKDEEITLTKGEDTKEAEDIWNHISEISPDKLSDNFLEEYTLFNDPESDTLAYVHDPDENGKWLIAINLAGYKTSSVKENNLTIIHELGHVITLNTSQINKDKEEESCKNYFLDEGCTETKSYLNLFVQKFWDNDDLEKIKGSTTVFAENKFITEYAATNPTEDIAESFSYFVLGGTEDSSEIKDQKKSFFNSFNELTEIKKEMRQGVYSDIIRARKK